jgi:hypothetical protein
MKRLAIAIAAAAMIVGCGDTDSKLATEPVKSDYVFEQVGYGNGLYITKVTNTKTGRSVRAMNQYGGGMVLLPSEF